MGWTNNIGYRRVPSHQKKQKLESYLRGGRMTKDINAYLVKKKKKTNLSLIYGMDERPRILTGT